MTTGAPKGRTGLDGFDGCKGFGFGNRNDGLRTGQRLVSFGSSPGIPPHPLTPSAGTLRFAKHPRLWPERAGEENRAFLEDSETRLTSLIRPDGFDDEFGLSAETGCLSLSLARHRTRPVQATSPTFLLLCVAIKLRQNPLLD